MKDRSTRERPTAPSFESLEPRELLNGNRVIPARHRVEDLSRIVRSVAAEVGAIESPTPLRSMDSDAPRTKGRDRTDKLARHIDPNQFVSTIDNPYFPLVPGTTFIYAGSQDGVPVRDEFTVTNETKQILGVTTTVIRDRAFLNGELVEETLDWFAQDKAGNVWYFGEDSKELENGVVVSTEGSWEAGVKGARPGIVMEARPRVGDSYRQEFAKRVAEDRATVLSLRQRVEVPYGSFDKCLKTRDFTPLEPDVVEHKFYCAGVGFTRSVMVKGGNETLELVQIIRS
jgi:hypothetical protein